MRVGKVTERDSRKQRLSAARAQDAARMKILSAGMVCGST